MARPSTRGSLEWVGDPLNPKATDHWRVRVTIGKARRWIKLPPSITRAQEKKARERAVRFAALASEGKIEAPPPPATPAPAGETLLTWSERWFAARVERGKLSTRADRSKFTTWVLSRLGEKPVEAITTADAEAWVEWVDREVQRGELAWKTAQSAWGLFSRAMADASRGKVKALRCRADNPCAGVVGPERGVTKSKPYLYPSELSALLACEGITVPVRRVYAATVYLYPRAGEIEALHWEDVDLEHGTVHFHRACDPDSGEIRHVKGKAARRFEIEPALLPLLVAMRAERPRDVRVFDPWPLKKDRAGELRAALRVAGVTRAELFAASRTRKHLTFHDLRATGTTWAAIRGDEPLRIMHRAGHKDLRTTMAYVREAENVGRAFGVVFPPLPPVLLGEGGSSQDSSQGGGGRARSAGKQGRNVVLGEGFELTSTGATERDRARDAGEAPEADAPLAPAAAPDCPAGTNPGTNATDALRAALDAALAGGDLDLATELLALLRARGAHLRRVV